MISLPPRVLAAIRSFLTGICGMLAMFGLLDQGMVAPLVDNLMAVIGSGGFLGFVIYSIVRARRLEKLIAKAKVAPVTPAVIAEVSKVLTPIEIAHAQKWTPS